MKSVTLQNPKRNLSFKYRFVVSLLLSACLSAGNFQSANAQEPKNQAYVNNATVEDQFIQVIEKSSKWETYKVVQETWLTNLRRNTLDSINSSKLEILNQKALVAEKERTVDTLQTALKETQEELVIAINNKNSFSVLGINTSKGFFLSITWIIILSLGVFSIVTLGLYRKSFAVIQKTKEELEKTVMELEDYRQETRKKQEQMVIQHHKEMQKLKGG